MFGRLGQELGYLGNSSTYNSILNGTYNPPEDTNQYTKDLLEASARLTQIVQPPKAIISTEAFTTRQKCIKEKTSTGISGIHFGYMKAYLNNRDLENFEATISHILYCTGYSPKEWKNIINTMIEKKEKKICLVI